jgi:hypothetical protein
LTTLQILDLSSCFMLGKLPRSIDQLTKWCIHFENMRRC